MKAIATNHRPNHRSAQCLSGLAAAVALSLAGTGVALAQGPWSFSANIGAVSNYMWRGTTQTGDGPAVQGGLDVAHESGFYAGTWASNIDWDEGSSEQVIGYVPVNPNTGRPIMTDDGYLVIGETSGADDDSPNYELDFYAGYDFTLPDENMSLGLNTIYYAYPDSGSDVDFWEIGISGGYDFGAAAASAGIQYTAWGGDANEGGPYSEGDLYYSLGLDFVLPYEFGLGIFGGYYDFKDDSVVVGIDTAGNDLTESADYWHWGATVSREAGEFGTFSFTYEQNGGEKEVYDDDAKFWVGWNKEF
ncbi:TorF family putative porin [Rhabdochromatium marinum]|uniref:TorF family putative porin n=1 Tax=Rhabdochromatium marinum TaxID=48729 RepID=UPI001906FF1C|nr:TorF family putative porin [Rhabdochromatium marinum]MBK1649732.1 hypothetical protein [Rhabdochromatium marinum]